MLPNSLSDPTLIAVNRTGLLTPQQRKFFLRLSPLPIWIPIVLIVIFVLPAVMLWADPSQDVTYAYPMLSGLGIGGVITTILGIRHWRQVMVQRREIETGPVISIEGAVVASKKGYVVQTMGKSVRVVGYKLDLIPGPYRFFYLPQSRLLLSAEKLNAPSKGKDVAVGYEAIKLMMSRVFKFTEEELGVNRGRKLSPRQQQRLLRDGGLYAAAALFTFLFAFLALSSSATPNETPTTIAWQPLLLSLFLGALGIYLGRQAWLHIRDAQNGVATQLEGKITLRVNVGLRQGAQIYYLIHDQEFSVPVKAHTALVEGLNYRLHYTPHAKKVLSVEPLEKR